MKLIIILFFAIPTCSFGQIYKHNRVFSDTTKFKDFNQGYIDSQEYFICTNDYLLGVASLPVRGIPAIISFLVPPKNNRLFNINNPNNNYLEINIDYYNGYKYGATRKKRKRLIQGTLTPILVFGSVFITFISSSSN